MKRILFFSFVVLLLCACNKGVAQQQPVKTGIEVLREQNFSLLEGKRVGLCTNPTGVDSQLKSTIDILNEAENVNLVALFGPEHGVRGNIHAGDVINTEVDAKTGITMYSLYGKTHKPTQEMMDLIDVMVYDIQDNGCRSYTYISTMGKLIEACKQYDKELVILDRPNPLGGKVEGNIVEDGCFSFVSLYRIPYLYGLTCGELARMLWDDSSVWKEPLEFDKGKLTIVPMTGWTRDMSFDDTGLKWVVASPHVPFSHSAYFYPATGIFGELGYLSIGVGYTLPFELMAASWIDADSLAEAMNALNLPGVRFRPIYYNPYYSVGKGETMRGIQIYITDFRVARLSEIQFLVVQELMRMYPDRDVFGLCNQSRLNMFDKVCGSKYIREHFQEHYRWSDVSDYWYKDVETFKQKAKKYELY
ncbi:MAG: DUF1343 domain-containing protein [Paludibacteraceae bacterium]|nr:DUF1343 domain-containing protein [Paludibacteraceae bacterium]